MLTGHSRQCVFVLGTSLSREPAFAPAGLEMFMACRSQGLLLKRLGWLRPDTLD
jgi:hypothetical protein